MVVEFGDRFGDVRDRGDEKQRRAGSGGIDDRAKIFLSGVTIDDGQKFVADALDDVVLSGVAVVLKRRLFAVELASEALALRLGLGFLLVGPGVLLFGKLLGDIVDLAVDLVEFFLAGAKLSFKIGKRLLPFRGGSDGQAEINNGDLGCGLRADASCCEEAGEGDKDCAKNELRVHGVLRWSEER